jgi:biotin synthase
MRTPIDLRLAPGQSLTPLLNAHGDLQEELFAAAQAARNRTFGAKVFVRAVVEVSNFCRQNCNYCGMRRDNRDLSRFRLSLDKLRRIVFDALPASVTDINIQAGEDPVVVREIVLPLIREIKAQTPLGVSVCLGTLPASSYQSLFEAGARYYIIKLETGDAAHYEAVQSPGTLEKRIEAILQLQEMGWQVSSGFIYGLPGQTLAHREATLRLLAKLPLTGNSVSPFIPGAQTPYASEPTADLTGLLNCLALMRLLNPDRIIPAVSALNIVGANGYKRALEIGANLATINLTPPEERGHYLLYKKDRFIMDETRVLAAVEKAGCTASATSLESHLAAAAPSHPVVSHQQFRKMILAA